MSVPYASASSGLRAREDITKILRQFGCSSIGFMDQFDSHSILLAFEHRGRSVRLEASAKGWAAMYLKENPWTTFKKISRSEWDHKALLQGMIAVNSILRDWVKGQVTAVETGVLSFEEVFFPHMIASDGRSILAHIQENKLLPAPKEQSNG